MPGSGTNSGPAADLLIELRRDSRVALHRQIETAIRDGIRSGRLQLGGLFAARQFERPALTLF